MRGFEAETGVEGRAGGRGAHIHGLKTRRIELEQRFHQPGGVPLPLKLGIGGDILEFAGRFRERKHHGLADGGVPGLDDVHFSRFKVTVDHRLAGIGEQEKREVLFLVGRDGLERSHDAPHTEKGFLTMGRGVPWTREKRRGAAAVRFRAASVPPV